MAKCLVGANGGGKVTVTGLTADVVLEGTEVTVKQGAKVVEQVLGSLKLLCAGGLGGNPGINGVIRWDGSRYVYGRGSSSNTFSGTPVIGYCMASRMNVNFCGNSIGSTGTNAFNTFTSFPSKTISFDVSAPDWGVNSCAWAVFGTD